MSDIKYKIALLGPTRVGKTSLVSSILSEAQTALAGTPVSMKANGSTFARIADNVNELESALAHGSFEPEAVRNSTSDKSVYELAFEVAKTKLPMSILDYPGGWLTAHGDAWNDCNEWIKESGVLIIPVDAVVAMQCVTAAERHACHSRLNLAHLVDPVRDWAKARRAAGEPGTIIFAPVKCETYLVGPQATRASAELLYHRVVEGLYAGLLDMLASELKGFDLVSAFYAPVNTMGCVDLVDAEWRMAEDKMLECHASFRVVPPGRRKVEGALDILILIARMIGQAENSRDRGMLETVWRFLNGEGKALRSELLRLNVLPLSQRARKIPLSGHA
jgi:hypothetical protein